MRVHLQSRHQRRSHPLSGKSYSHRSTETKSHQGRELEKAFQKFKFFSTNWFISLRMERLMRGRPLSAMAKVAKCFPETTLSRLLRSTLCSG